MDQFAAYNAVAWVSVAIMIGLTLALAPSR